jgi:hypothetical protein
MSEIKPKIPNFLIVGAAKSGTTSLYGYLKGHPDVFLPETVKEPLYFVFGEEETHFDQRDWRSVKMQCSIDWSAYLALFDKAKGESAIGEATPYYLTHPAAPAKIAHRLGSPKIIAILRDPIGRGYSHYTYNRMRKVERAESFAEAVEAEFALDSPFYAIKYLGSGLYSAMIERYFDQFGRENVLVLRFEDLVRDREGVLAKVYAHLGIDPGYVPPDEVHNVTLEENAITSTLFHLKGSDSLLGKAARGGHRIMTRSDLYLKTKERLFNTARKVAADRGAGKPEKLDPAVRAKLLPVVEEDVRRLEELLGWDCEAWRT